MGFLIDTSLWIAIERGRVSAGDVHAITGQAPIYLSPVNLAEIRFGIYRMADAKHKQRAMAMLRRMRRSSCASAPKRPKSSAPSPPPWRNPGVATISGSRISGSPRRQSSVNSRY